MIVVTLGVALLGIPAYSSVSKVMPAGTFGGNSIDKPAHSRPALFSCTRNISVATTDPVTDWNAIMQMTVAPTNPFFQARSNAIVQLAVFEAVNAILKDHEPCLGTIAAPTGASPQAAAITAAHRTLVTLHPAVRQVRRHAGRISLVLAIRPCS